MSIVWALVHFSMAGPHQWNNLAWSSLDKCRFHSYTKGKCIYSDCTGSSIFPSVVLQPTWIFRKEYTKKEKLQNNPVFSNTQQSWCTLECKAGNQTLAGYRALRIPLHQSTQNHQVSQLVMQCDSFRRYPAGPAITTYSYFSNCDESSETTWCQSLTIPEPGTSLRSAGLT